MDFSKSASASQQTLRARRASLALPVIRRPPAEGVEEVVPIGAVEEAACPAGAHCIVAPLSKKLLMFKKKELKPNLLYQKKGNG